MAFSLPARALALALPLALVLARPAPLEPHANLLDRFFFDVEHRFGSLEARVSAADADISPADAALAAAAVPPLDELRARVFNGGQPAFGASPGELSLSLTDDLSEMRVSWATQDAVDAPRVVLFDDVGATLQTTAADSMQYSVPEKWWPVFNGFLHTAVLTGLPPATTFAYQVGSGDAGNASTWSDVQWFTSAPAPLTRTTVVTFGDQGTIMPLGFATAEKLTAVMDSLDSDGRPVDMVMHVGDLSYAGMDTAIPALNVSKDDEFEWLWDLWQLQNQPVASSRPWMVGLGNHEAWYNWTAATSRFHMPAGPVAGTARPPFWWSMDHGFAHWIQLCSEFSLDAGSLQGEWFAEDLAAAAAARNTGKGPMWLVVTIHRPPYSSDNSWTNIREALEPLLLEHGVNLVVSGHMHAFERTHAIGANASTVTTPARQVDGFDVYDAPNAPIYITQGNAGAGQAERWQRPTPEWSAVRWANGRIDGSSVTHDGSWAYSDSFGFGAAHFVNATCMFYESVPVTGDFYDRFWLTREPTATTAAHHVEA